ncbi:hypothetical protein HAV1_gp17 [Hyperthermophilic Archaeal Virus 1]|uniref:hypothetical protein n=1 Tax=Hyperthermophilic Archaeal Virus 1 TaxID=762905 RepID=UPI0001DBADFC|nr:hypothetical protein HAV1_gp17 [Hyperthermophilic Archaeal Virus 1]ADJ54240.1 hypothetical protein HAV1_gp17 [Hyperthermophilic Archaeal Virus 1]
MRTRSRRLGGTRSRRDYSYNNILLCVGGTRSRFERSRRRRLERSRREVRLSTPVDIYIIIYLLHVGERVPDGSRSRRAPVPGELVPAVPLWRNV